MTTYEEFGFSMFKKYEKNLEKMTVFKYLYIVSDNCSDSEYSWIIFLNYKKKVY